MLTRRALVHSGVATGVFGRTLVSRAADAMPDGRPWPSVKAGNVHDLKTNTPVSFNYPEANSPAWLLKLKEPAYEGVGSDKNIVAYSGICTHMGCPVTFVGEQFVCPCHYSMFDPAKNGQVYQGLASEYLPQIVLRIDAAGDIHAVRMSGLVWGRMSDLPAQTQS